MVAMPASRCRVEEDLLGRREVPVDAYYGVHTVRAIENFEISGQTVNDVPAMIRGMVMVKMASAPSREMDVAAYLRTRSPPARGPVLDGAWTSSP
jgi:aspartate ammonia-lyase